MRLWIKLLGLILGIVTITGVAATIRKVRNDKALRRVESAKSGVKGPSAQPVSFQFPEWGCRSPDRFPDCALGDPC
jgi:hypothetical protein